jgi:hypothetical protein
VETLFKLDWQSMFVPTESVLEVILRGTIMYLGMFVLLRIFSVLTESPDIRKQKGNETGPPAVN